MEDGASKDAAVVHKVGESRGIPILSMVLGYAAMAPLAIAAIAVWLAPTGLAAPITDLAAVWGGAILAFLAGVRRGVSFRTEHGPATAQIVIMFWLFALALAALLAPWPGVRLALLVLGYTTLLIADRPAARAGRLPLFMARLRPAQMGLAVAALLVLLAHGQLQG